MLIQKYSESWEKDFQTLKMVLETNLQNIKTTIEHIGSTAVPNLDAKPIIDIDIIYYNSTDFEVIKNQLEKMGYCHNGNQGIIDREVFKRTTKHYNSILDIITHHLYVCPSDSEELRWHLFFRDYLRNNTSARNEYQDLKYKIAQEANQNKKKYAELKEEKAKYFISKILSQ